ncbi:MAG: hypothetical protein JXB50_12090 [Spirochaetes bacterium]|nr:hypothetical protein [Spirochaetota bacterium]
MRNSFNLLIKENDRIFFGLYRIIVTYEKVDNNFIELYILFHDKKVECKSKIYPIKKDIKIDDYLNKFVLVNSLNIINREFLSKKIKRMHPYDRQYIEDNYKEEIDLDNEYLRYFKKIYSGAIDWISRTTKCNDFRNYLNNLEPLFYEEDKYIK